MGWFWKKEIREEQQQTSESSTIVDPVLRALLEKNEVSRENIMNIPSVASCLNRIADTIGSLNIKLYRRNGNQVEEVVDDIRTTLLNEHTGDTLDGFQFKRAMVLDMYLDKGGYAYIHKEAGEIKSIHYVEASKIGFQYNTDPIFKDYKILVNGKAYEGWRFIKLLRNTVDGFRGKSILEESPILLSIIYSTQMFEQNMVKTGGNKKGFLKSTNRISQEAIVKLKNAFRKLYSNNTENVVILNDGLDFKESSNTSVELQLNENKETNNADVCKIFQIPPSILNGGATEEDKKQYLESCLLPNLERFVTAINQVLLLEEEKDTYFFAFDTWDLLKGDMEKRFRSYKFALDSGFMQLDEVRQNEKLPLFGLDFIKLGLQDVLYYPKTDEIYTPNTDKKLKIKERGDSEDGN